MALGMTAMWLNPEIRLVGTTGSNRCKAGTRWKITNDSNGSIAQGQHTPKQSLGNGQIPLAALRCRADLLESPWAMTAFGSSSHWYL